ncbi:lariat debranching enzyme [Colletotrichum asianum]
MVRLAVIEALPDAAHRRDPQRAQAQHVRRAEVVDVGRRPAAVVELPQVRRGLVVAGREDGQVRRDAAAGVVLPEVAELAVLCGDGHYGEVCGVAGGLEIAADDEDVDAVPATSGAGGGDGGVDRVERAVALDLLRRRERRSSQMFAWPFLRWSLGWVL